MGSFLGSPAEEGFHMLLQSLRSSSISERDNGILVRAMGLTFKVSPCCRFQEVPSPFSGIPKQVFPKKKKKKNFQAIFQFRKASTVLHFVLMKAAFDA